MRRRPSVVERLWKRGAPRPAFVPVRVTAERAEPVIELMLSGGGASRSMPARQRIWCELP